MYDWTPGREALLYPDLARLSLDSYFLWQNSWLGAYSFRAVFPSCNSCGGAGKTLGSCFLHFWREWEKSASDYTPPETKARFWILMSSIKEYPMLIWDSNRTVHRTSLRSCPKAFNPADSVVNLFCFCCYVWWRTFCHSQYIKSSVSAIFFIWEQL